MIGVPYRSDRSDRAHSWFFDFEQEREVIGCAPDVRRPDDLARSYMRHECSGDKGVVEAHVRIRCRQRVPEIIRMQLSVRIDVPCREHRRNRTPADMPAAQPYEWTEALRQLRHVEDVARRHRIEVSDE